jgi:hypothetical protein
MSVPISQFPSTPIIPFFVRTQAVFIGIICG